MTLSPLVSTALALGVLLVFAVGVVVLIAEGMLWWHRRKSER